MNILDNALKYSRAPSKIFVKAEFTKLENENFVKNLQLQTKVAE